MLPFFARKAYKLTFLPKGREDYVVFTNITGYTAQCFSLVRAGYGTLSEVQDMDSPDFLDAIEYGDIISSIEDHVIDQN